MSQSLGRATGRLPAQYDPRVPMLTDFVKWDQLPPAPDEINWSAAVQGEWSMLMNNVRGCCMFSALGHAVQQFSTYINYDERLVIEDQEIDDAYQLVTGWRPTEQDQVGPGTYALGARGALPYWHTTGLLLGGEINRLNAAARLNIRDRYVFRQAINTFGGAMVGVDLYANARNADKTWVAGGEFVGGHEIWVNGARKLQSGDAIYDLVSWGQEMECPEELLFATMREAQVLADGPFLEKFGTDFDAIPVATLESIMRKNFTMTV